MLFCQVWFFSTKYLRSIREKLISWNEFAQWHNNYAAVMIGGCLVILFENDQISVSGAFRLYP